MSACTPHQRLYIRCLLRETPLGAGIVTLRHRALFRRAHLPEPVLGIDLDSHLRLMDKTEAARLVDAIRETYYPPLPSRIEQTRVEATP